MGIIRRATDRVNDQSPESLGDRLARSYPLVGTIGRRRTVRRYQRNAQINAPVDRVWAILADVERWPEWTASVSRIEMLDRQPLGLGSRVRIHQPKLRPAIWVVTEWEPEALFVWRTAAPGIAIAGGHFLEACDVGCRVTLDLRFTGWLGGLIGVLKGRLAERYIGLEAEGLKLRAQGLA